jgi:hypothetical protein
MLMADFCKQCSIAIFGEDFGDLAGITSKEDWKRGYSSVALCEDCGAIQVDPDGNCISIDCRKKHGETKDEPLIR